ncbi:MAG TPA: hypothetical protein VG276_27965 [Actinomycetes bacterium]|jgi:hypothetical protein|nr:hypothetical protein [Actinomycetes bacterium]
MPREKIATWPSDRASRVTVRASESLTADRVLTVAEIEQFQMFVFAPTAARNLDLPAEAASAGAYLFIYNASGGAFSLTVRNPAAATIATVAQNKAAILFCDGAAWRALVGA